MKASELATEYVQTLSILTTNGIHHSDALEIAYKLLELANSLHDGTASACGFVVPNNEYEDD
jgi:hypothetical protein